jgi:hypothetical protein
MLATIEQSVETATKILDIPVSIFPTEPGTFSHAVKDLVAKGPKGATWIMTWTLNPSDLTVTFLEPPIIFTSPLPKGVNDDHLERLSPTQARLTFTSNVFDVNAIRYDLKLDVLDGEGNRLVRSKRITIDPTIAIVEDPIGG